MKYKVGDGVIFVCHFRRNIFYMNYLRNILRFLGVWNGPCHVRVMRKNNDDPDKLHQWRFGSVVRDKKYQAG